MSASATQGGHNNNEKYTIVLGAVGTTKSPEKNPKRAQTTVSMELG